MDANVTSCLKFLLAYNGTTNNQDIQLSYASAFHELGKMATRTLSSSSGWELPLPGVQLSSCLYTPLQGGSLTGPTFPVARFPREFFCGPSLFHVCILFKGSLPIGPTLSYSDPRPSLRPVFINSLLRPGRCVSSVFLSLWVTDLFLFLL